MVFAPGYGAVIMKSSLDVKIKKGSFDKPYDDVYDKQKNYLNDCIANEMDKYKSKNKGNYKISLTQQRKDRDNIRANVKFTSLKERVKFFNNEFNKFGIEFIYITP